MYSDNPPDRSDGYTCSPKPFIAFRRTSTSLSGSAPGKSLMEPLNPLYEKKTRRILTLDMVHEMYSWKKTSTSYRNGWGLRVGWNSASICRHRGVSCRGSRITWHGLAWGGACRVSLWCSSRLQTKDIYEHLMSKKW